MKEETGVEKETEVRKGLEKEEKEARVEKEVVVREKGDCSEKRVAGKRSRMIVKRVG